MPNKISETREIREIVPTNYSMTNTNLPPVLNSATINPSATEIRLPPTLPFEPVLTRGTSPTEKTPTAPAGEPLVLDFPTPALPPMSSWRPPLYEVPWAVGPHDHFYFVRPIAVDQVNWPLPDYRYGATFFGPDIVHTGIDIVAPRNTPVLAAGSGTIIWAGNGLYFGSFNPKDPYGEAVVIQHDFGYQGKPLYTVYAHMDRVDVVKGQYVNIGKQVGIVGNTGMTTGPHLHFEVRVGENNFFVTRNPELWLSPPQGWGILVGRLVNEKNTFIEKLDVDIHQKDGTRKWKVRTYANLAVNSDDYYRENLVLSDLPEGEYSVQFSIQGNPYEYNINIQAGMIGYFIFHSERGFLNTQPTVSPPEQWLKTPIP